MPEVTPLLEALEEILNPRVVTYTGKLYKAWQLLGSIGQEKSPYENVLREVDADLDALNRSLRALNASIGHYIDRLTRNRTPQEVLELFDQYEEKVVAAAYHASRPATTCSTTAPIWKRSWTTARRTICAAGL